MAKAHGFSSLREIIVLENLKHSYIFKRVMDLKKQYRNGVLLPAGIAFLISIFYATFDNQDYESEWLTRESAISICVMFSGVYLTFLCLLSSTIFLVRIEKIRNNGFWILLSWFLLPFSFIGITINHEVQFMLKYEGGLNKGIIPTLIMTIPMTVGLIISFYNYNRSSKI